MQTTNVLGRLESQWEARYQSQTNTYGALGQWSGQDLVDHLRETAKVDQPRSDTIARELIRLTQHGHRAAETLLLVAMRPKLLRFARTTTALRSLRHNEAVSIAVTSLWQAIRVFPLEKRTPHHTLGGLALDALRIITRDPLRPFEEIPVDVADLGDIAAHGGHDVLGSIRASVDGWSDLASPALQLKFVLQKAFERGIIDAHNLRILLATELGTREQQHELARELGITRDSMTRMSRRTIARLSKTLITGATT